MPDSLFDMLDPYEANAARTRRRAPTREPDPLSLYASQGGVSWDKFLPSEQRAMQSAASLQAGGNYDPRDVFLGALGAVGAPAMGPAQGGAVLGSGAIKPIRAYHGSPHDFDRFDLSKIGTGEGAQAYGHGLYFAENPATAKAYRESLAGKPYQYLEPHAIKNEFADVAGFDPQAIVFARTALGENRGNVLETLRTLDQVALNGHGRAKEAAQVIRAMSPTIAEKTPGKMYEVNINAAPEQFLDWDKPLARQSPDLMTRIKDIPEMQQSLSQAPDMWSNLTGQTVNDLLVPRGQGPGQSYRASQTMREAGIPGIKYLDQGSRIGGDAEKIIANYGSREKALEIAQQRLKSASTGDLQYWDKIVNQLKTPETSNYVLFRDDIIDIVKKYGLAGAAAMYGISQDEAKAAMDNPKDKKMSIGRQTYGDEE